MAKTNFVLIDFENVQPNDLHLLLGGPYKIKVFLGAQQTKMPIEMALALQPFGVDAEYIQVEGAGSNALDFHIAYYIGLLSGPDTFFHIISKDTGFDPLIKHIKKKSIFCLRSVKIADLPLLKVSKNSAVEEMPSNGELQVNAKPNIPKKTTKVDSVIEKLISQKTARPRTLKTLERTIKAHLANGIDDEDLLHLITILAQQGVIKINDGKVSYKLPE